MKRSYLFCGVFAALLVFGPAGLRALSWERSRPEPIDGALAKAGEVLFKHEFQPNDPLCANGDGLGPVFNDRSCVACHHQGGPGGGGSLEHNVTTFVMEGPGVQGKPREGVVHAYGTTAKSRETLKHVHPQLPEISRPTLAQITPPSPRLATKGGRQDPPQNMLKVPDGVQLSQRNTPALFGANLIDAIPDRILIAQERRQRLANAMAPSDSEMTTVGRVHRLPSGGIGRFGWKAQMAHLSDFVQAACANELGLGNPGQKQPQSLAQTAMVSVGLDLSQLQCDQLTGFVAALPRPAEKLPVDAELQRQVNAGRAHFGNIGCADCHTPSLGSVEGIYSDLLLHRMGSDLQGSGVGYGGSPTPDVPTFASHSSRPLPDEWRTPPLWGVADSAPYLHDGRAATLKDAIQLHGGQGAPAARRFERMSQHEQLQLIAFLHTLRAP